MTCHPTHRPLSRFNPPAARAIGAGLALALLAGGPALGQRKERQGQEVVEAACASCHAPGKDRAPKIGDATAWSARARLGLTALTEHAISGIRKMPAHGGAAGVSDIEIERAITYMVNRSGGRWVEPLSGASPAVLRSSGQVVQLQCAKCHQEGLEGAPKIGDRTAWIARLRKGLDPLVASAVHGHGGMPARGGLADLSDEQIRGAIVHMFNAGVPAAPAVAAAAPASPFHRRVGDVDLYLGVMAAERMRAARGEGRTGGAAIPSGKEYMHVNISLADATTHVSLTDAEVTVKVADGLAGESRVLDLIADNNAVSYGGFFRMGGRLPYTITAQIRRPGMPETLEARFEYKPR
jgi:cytochrome c5